jgi:hypothetical protein
MWNARRSFARRDGNRGRPTLNRVLPAGSSCRLRDPWTIPVWNVILPPGEDG